MHALHRLSRLLLSLPGLAPAATHDFRTEVFEQLAAAIAADSGIWASGALTPTGPDFHTVALWRQPPGLLADYEPLKQHDPLFQRVAAQPGRAFSGSAAQTLPPVFAPFVARYGLAQALSALVVDAQSGLLHGLSLWRRAADQPFSTEDETLLEAALPHVIAEAQSRLLRAASTAPPVAAARACVDLRGRLHAASPHFLALLPQRWPGWRGPDVPPELAAGLDTLTRARQLRLDPLVVRLAPRDGYVLIDVRPRQAWDTLSAREQTVAALAAQGDSHKDIARMLGLAPATVRNHLARVYQVLDVHNRAQLQASQAAAAFGPETR